MCAYGVICIEFGVKGGKVAVGKLISGSPLHNSLKCHCQVQFYFLTSSLPFCCTQHVKCTLLLYCLSTTSDNAEFSLVLPYIVAQQQKLRVDPLLWVSVFWQILINAVTLHLCCHIKSAVKNHSTRKANRILKICMLFTWCACSSSQD